MEMIIARKNKMKTPVYWEIKKSSELLELSIRNGVAWDENGEENSSLERHCK